MVTSSMLLFQWKQKLIYRILDVQEGTMKDNVLDLLLKLYIEKERNFISNNLKHFPAL